VPSFSVTEKLAGEQADCNEIAIHEAFAHFRHSAGTGVEIARTRSRTGIVERSIGPVSNALSCFVRTFYRNDLLPHLHLMQSIEYRMNFPAGLLHQFGNVFPKLSGA